MSEWYKKNEKLYGKFFWDKVSVREDDVKSADGISMSVFEPIMRSVKLNVNEYISDVLYDVESTRQHMKEVMESSEINHAVVGFFGIRKYGCDNNDFILSKISADRIISHNYDDIFAVCFEILDKDWTTAYDSTAIRISVQKASVLR